MAAISSISIDATGGGLSYETSGALSKPELEFTLELERLLLRVETSFPNPEQRKVVIDGVAKAVNSRLGNIQFDKSKLLEVAQLPILAQSNYLKASYLNSLLKYLPFPIIAGIIICAILVLCVIKLNLLYSVAAPLEQSFVGAVVNIIGGFGFALLGLLAGATLSIFVSNRRMTIDNFDKIQRYGLSIKTYFVYLYIVTAVVLLLLWFKIVVHGIGSVTLNQVAEKPYFGLLIGLLCGISDPIIADWVIQVVKPSKHTSQRGN